MSDPQGLGRLEEGDLSAPKKSRFAGLCSSADIVHLLQKLLAEVVASYFFIFAGCGSIVVNKIYGSITFPGVAIIFGLTAMIMIYSVGHISGAHFNPAVTIAFAIYRDFPLKQVPLYILAQLLGSILASGTLCLVFTVHADDFFGTVPVGSYAQSLVIEMIASFLLMFVISGVATDNRAIGQMAGIAIGMTILVDVFVLGPVSGGSMNPARSIGPAVVMKIFKGLWIYIVGPIIGTILGGLVYHLVRFTDKPLKELTKSASMTIKSVPILKTMSRNTTFNSRT